MFAKSRLTSGERGVPAAVFRKGLNLKHAVAGTLATDYHSQLIDEIKNSNFTWRNGRLVVHLAAEFGFCYGVDRAVDYAYQTRARFPDQRVYLTGEIIHNPQVNALLRQAGVGFLSDPGQSVEQVDAADVVILPAFGVSVDALQQLDRRGCTLIDTTCGSVLNVWKAVKRYTAEGFTAVIHGKVHHEETKATASQALLAENGRYLIILDRDEATLVCDFIRGRTSVDQFRAAFSEACSPGFDPVTDLCRVGLANQTTMLMSESVEIGEMIRLAMIAQYGPDVVDNHYQAFETICSATQDRQDAVNSLLSGQRFDLAVVIGGYNSSNTRNLARICAERLPTYHIAEANCLVSVKDIRHRPACGLPPAGGTGNVAEITSSNWLPANDVVHIAITAGASTPDSIVGDVISRLATFVNESSVSS